jgi:hypothetical protein
MRGRTKGMTERIVLVAHQTEAMARQKLLKAPDHYLNPLRHRRRAGVRSVVAAMLQAEKRGLNVTVRRLEPPTKGTP